MVGPGKALESIHTMNVLTSIPTILACRPHMIMGKALAGIITICDMRIQHSDAHGQLIHAPKSNRASGLLCLQRLHGNIHDAAVLSL